MGPLDLSRSWETRAVGSQRFAAPVAQREDEATGEVTVVDAIRSETASCWPAPSRM